MKKILILAMMLILTAVSGNLWCQSWYTQNTELRSIFPSNIWTCIEKARDYYNSGDMELTEKFLRKAEQLTLAAEPFNPKNWPSHWPRTQEAIDIIRYAPPSAYIYRILGDYAYERSRPKEAIKYIKMYLNLSYIPDAAYLYKLGNIFESEGLYSQAINTYQELLRCIDARNVHNRAPSLSTINQRIRILNARIEPQVVLILDMRLQDLPDYLQNAGSVFKEKVSGLGKQYIVVSDQVLDKTLAEQILTRKDIINDIEERAKIASLLNVKYILEPFTVKIENMYIFQVRVYRAGQKDPVETYEYKSENYEFLPNFFERFFIQFQGEQIPDALLIPENSYQWTFETSDLVTDIAVSKNGNSIIAGCSDGRVYIFSRSGRIQGTFKEPDEIVRVAISPDGKFVAWASLGGRICLAENLRIVYQSKVKNLVRAISISENGKFWVYAINEKIFFLDKKGEVFWDRSVSDWVKNMRISADGNWVVAGTTTGQLVLYNGEGNIAWSKNLGSQIENIRFSPEIENISACVKNNIVYVFSISGVETLRFTLGDDVRFLSFNQDILDSVCGIWNRWYYFPDKERKKIWYYQIDKSVRVADSASVVNFYSLGKGKNILTYNVIWK